MRSSRRRKGVVADGVGGDRGGLADDRDAAGATRGRDRVLVGELRVLVDELCRHREMTRDRSAFSLLSVFSSLRAAGFRSRA